MQTTTATPHTPSTPAPASLGRFWFLFLVAFVEGGAVMAVEITGARV